MGQVKDPVLDQIRERLVKELNPKKLYLFGSRARGDHKTDSDYDLVAIIESSNINMRERNVQAREALWGIRAAVDVFVYTQKEFDELKGEFSSVPELTLHEGREVDLA